MPTTQKQPDRKVVVAKLLTSARLMEVQMDTLYNMGQLESAEAQFQMINGIYSRIKMDEYKAYFTA